jgi:carbon storage regulator
MLILKRRSNEAIVIGGHTVVRVLKAEPGQVTLGIVAPESVSVHRQEIQDRVDREQRERGRR